MEQHLRDPLQNCFQRSCILTTVYYILAMSEISVLNIDSDHSDTSSVEFIYLMRLSRYCCSCFRRAWAIYAIFTFFVVQFGASVYNGLLPMIYYTRCYVCWM